MYISKFDKIYRQIINEWNTGIYTQQEQKSDIPQEIKSAVGDTDQLWYIKGLNKQKESLFKTCAKYNIFYHPLVYQMKFNKNQKIMAKDPAGIKYDKLSKQEKHTFSDAWLQHINIKFIDKNILIISIPQIVIEQEKNNFSRSKGINKLKDIKNKLQKIVSLYNLNQNDVYYYSKATGKITL